MLMFKNVPLQILKFSSNENIKGLKYRDIGYLVPTMLCIWRKLMYGLVDLNHVVFLEKI